MFARRIQLGFCSVDYILVFMTYRMYNEGYKRERCRNSSSALDDMLNVGTRTEDKLQKRNIQCSDGSKYMSYLKVRWFCFHHYYFPMRNINSFMFYEFYYVCWSKCWHLLSIVDMYWKLVNLSWRTAGYLNWIVQTFIYTFYTIDIKISEKNNKKS